MQPKQQPERGWGKRNVFCGYYDRCLDLAIKRSWGQWRCNKCRECENYEAAPEMMLTINHAVPYYEVSNGI